jgi:hypothetical protein
MRLHQIFRDGQPKSHPARIAGFIESLEDVRQIGGFDARTVILDKEQNASLPADVPDSAKPTFTSP